MTALSQDRIWSDWAYSVSALLMKPATEMLKWKHGEIERRSVFCTTASFSKSRAFLYRPCLIVEDHKKCGIPITSSIDMRSSEGAFTGVEFQGLALPERLALNPYPPDHTDSKWTDKPKQSRSALGMGNWRLMLVDVVEEIGNTL